MTTNLVRQVITNKGGKITIQGKALWYGERGIYHAKVGPRSFQPNPRQRAYLTIVDMAKVILQRSGLPQSF